MISFRSNSGSNSSSSVSLPRLTTSQILQRIRRPETLSEADCSEQELQDLLRTDHERDVKEKLTDQGDNDKLGAMASYSSPKRSRGGAV